MAGSFHDIRKLLAEAPQGEADYAEFLKVPSMSAGLYRLRAGADDPQKPHRQDEVYYILSGHGQFTSAGETQHVAPGAFLYVPKLIEHRFHDIEEDMEILVLFAPAENADG